MSTIQSVAELEKIYGVPAKSSLVKVSSSITPLYRRLIEASPFVALATSGPEGLDCSPRGDSGQVVHVVDESTLRMPDRRGNDRIDSLRNIVRDPRVGMLFLLPGSGSTMRVNGRAQITVAQDVLDSFTVEGKPPRSVVQVAVDEVYFQCARAIVRSGLWSPERFLDTADLPTPGEILAEMSGDEIGGPLYDRDWPDRARRTLW